MAYPDSASLHPGYTCCDADSVCMPGYDAQCGRKQSVPGHDPVRGSTRAPSLLHGPFFQHVIPALLRSRRADRGFDVLHFFGRRQHGRHPE